MIEASPNQLTNFNQFFEELDAGCHAGRITIALSDTALAVVSQEGNKNKGKVTLTFEIKRVGDSN